MSSTVNRNVAPASAHAENRNSSDSPPSSHQSIQESPPLNAHTPGQHVYSVEGPLNQAECYLILEKEKEKNEGKIMNLEKIEDSGAVCAQNQQVTSQMACSDVQESETCGVYQKVESGDTPTKIADNELVVAGLIAVPKGKKAVAPEIAGERNGLPATIVSDMTEFVDSIKPCKFVKSDNIATKLTQKFKKTLICPKCEILHGHTSQGTASNQYGGTAPYNKCRSSVQQITMMLPQQVINAIGRIYKLSSPKDASLFAAWLGSSKASRKEEIIKNLNFEMQIDDQAFEFIEEDFIDELMEELVPDRATQASKEVVGTYSEAEQNATLSQEIIVLRNRIIALESENSLLRQENAVLKKYKPVPMQLKEQKLPTSTTSLTPANSYLDVAKVYTPKPVILKRPKQDTASESIYKPKVRPEVDLSLFTTDNDKDKGRESSKLVFVYFKGLLRRRQSEYRALFDKIGFGGFKARDILFLSEDFMQVLTYEDCVDELVTLIGKFFPSARYVKDADPTDPINYESHGKLSKKFLEDQYFITMQGAVERFRKLASEKPFLKRTLYFLEKVVATRNIKYEKSPEKPKVFLMNSFMNLNICESLEKKRMPDVVAPATSDQAPMEISQ